MSQKQDEDQDEGEDQAQDQAQDQDQDHGWRLFCALPAPSLVLSVAAGILQCSCKHGDFSSDDVTLCLFFFFSIS